MLTKRDLAEAQVLWDRLQRGSITREDWSNLAALTIMAQGSGVVTSIAAQGLNEFIAVCRGIYEGHAFQFDDYKRIYARICAAATDPARVRMAVH